MSRHSYVCMYVYPNDIIMIYVLVDYRDIELFSWLSITDFSVRDQHTASPHSILEPPFCLVYVIRTRYPLDEC